MTQALELHPCNDFAMNTVFRIYVDHAVFRHVRSIPCHPAHMFTIIGTLSVNGTVRCQQVLIARYTKVSDEVEALFVSNGEEEMLHGRAMGLVMRSPVDSHQIEQYTGMTHVPMGVDE